MVEYVSSLGTYLGYVEGFDFHAFPTLHQLSLVSEQQLRSAGFGYRFGLLRFI
jgi:N-glycosylase/DNA lyase